MKRIIFLLLGLLLTKAVTAQSDEVGVDWSLDVDSKYYENILSIYPNIKEDILSKIDFAKQKIQYGEFIRIITPFRDQFEDYLIYYEVAPYLNIANFVFYTENSGQCYGISASRERITNLEGSCFNIPIMSSGISIDRDLIRGDGGISGLVIVTDGFIEERLLSLSISTNKIILNSDLEERISEISND